MVLNRNGGKNTKKKGRKSNRQKTYSLDDLIPSSSDNQEYGYVTEKYGDGRFSIMCYDKVQRLGIVRGAIKQKSRIVKGSLVLLSLRPYEDAKCDILYQYTEEDINKLTRAKSLHISFIKSGKLSTEDDDNDSENPFTSEMSPIFEEKDAQSKSENKSDTQSTDSIKAWESDDSDDRPKTNQKYPDFIVNDIRSSMGNLTDEGGELNIDDI